MADLENKLSTPRFWLLCGLINHAISCLVVIGGCLYSGMSCEGEAMTSVISIYTFTLFTPQVALEVIVLLALFLVKGTLRSMIDNWKLFLAFISSFVLPILLLQ